MNKKSKNKIIFFAVLIMLFFALLILSIVSASNAGQYSGLNTMDSSKIDDKENALDMANTKLIDDTTVRDAIEISNKDVLNEYRSINNNSKNTYKNNNNADKDDTENLLEDTKNSLENADEYQDKQQATVIQKTLSFNNSIDKDKEIDINIKRDTGVLEGICSSKYMTNNSVISIYIYESGKVDWAAKSYGSNYYKRVKLKEDGSFNVNIDIGKYDILIDAPGYLDYIVRNVTIESNKISNVGNKELIPGDVNKDGVIDNKDNDILNEKYSLFEGEVGYTLNCDFNQNGIICLSDLLIISENFNKTKTIEKF